MGGGARRPGSRRVLEEPPTPLSWLKGARLLINDPARFEGARVIGVDEHVWHHTPYGDTYVTVILDVTPVRDRSGPSRLLDMIPGRSKKVFTTWLASQPNTWRENIEHCRDRWIHRL